jgi:hypothetical protein
MSYAIIDAGKEAQALAKAFARKGVEAAILTFTVLIAGFATLIAVPAGLQAQEPPKNISHHSVYHVTAGARSVARGASDNGLSPARRRNPVPPPPRRSMGNGAGRRDHLHG